MRALPGRKVRSRRPGRGRCSDDPHSQSRRIEACRRRAGSGRSSLYRRGRDPGARGLRTGAPAGGFQLPGLYFLSRARSAVRRNGPAPSPCRTERGGRPAVAMRGASIKFVALGRQGRSTSALNVADDQRTVTRIDLSRQGPRGRSNNRKGQRYRVVPIDSGMQTPVPPTPQ